MADVGDYSQNYGYDRLGVTDRIGYPDGSPVWAANRFTARSIRSIAAVGFYTLSSGTPYEVWAGAASRRSPGAASGTATLPGYATVKLDTPLPVVKGGTLRGRRQADLSRREPCRWRSSGSAHGRPARPGPGDGRQRDRATSGPKRWRMKDLTSTIPKANVCLKAFAR